MVPYITPSTVYVGDPILLTAVVSEAGLPVTGCNVTVKSTSPSNVSETVTLFDDGAHFDGSADDGEYAENFRHTYEAGTYHFLFHATGYSRDGEPAVREIARDKVVLPKHDRPDGGGKGGDDECCQKLLRAIQNQTRALEHFLETARKR